MLRQMVRRAQGVGPAVARLLLGLAQMAGAVISSALLLARGLNEAALATALLTTCLTLYSRTRRWHTRL
jgi:hypothetical protein